MQNIYIKTYKFIKSNHELFYNQEDQRPTRTRAEAKFKPEDAAAAVNLYIDALWEGVKDRLTKFDKEGTTSWSEAPAEGIFSILSYIIENKPNLTFKHMLSLCRIVQEGPSPGSTSAINMTVKCLAKQPSSAGPSGRFLTQKWLHGLTS